MVMSTRMSPVAERHGSRWLRKAVEDGQQAVILHGGP